MPCDDETRSSAHGTDARLSRARLLEKNGCIADSSKTYLVGEVNPVAKRLVQTTYEAMWKGIRAVRPGARLGDIGYAIERHAKRNGYSVVRESCGHGIGREMHEEPQVRHFGKPGTGLALREGTLPLQLPAYRC